MNKVFITTLLAAAICLPALSARPLNRKIDNKFARLDINQDGVLSETEFLASQSRRSPVVLALHRFQAADVNQDGRIDLTEFRASRGGKTGGKPNRIRQFILADKDSDSRLDPAEYADTLGQRTAWTKVLKSFGKRDRDNDSLLTPREFGIRNFPL